MPIVVRQTFPLSDQCGTTISQCQHKESRTTTHVFSSVCDRAEEPHQTIIYFSPEPSAQEIFNWLLCVIRYMGCLYLLTWCSTMCSQQHTEITCVQNLSHLHKPCHCFGPKSWRSPHTAVILFTISTVGVLAVCVKTSPDLLSMWCHLVPPGCHATCCQLSVRDDGVYLCRLWKCVVCLRDDRLENVRVADRPQTVGHL